MPGPASRIWQACLNKWEWTHDLDCRWSLWEAPFFPILFPSWYLPLTKLLFSRALWALGAVGTIRNNCFLEPYDVVLGPWTHSDENFRVGRAGPATHHSPPLNFTAASRPPQLFPHSNAENHLRKEWEEENCFEWGSREEYQIISGPKGILSTL